MATKDAPVPALAAASLQSPAPFSFDDAALSWRGRPINERLYVLAGQEVPLLGLVSSSLSAPSQHLCRTHHLAT
ncbi:hypothetical protein HPB50_012466 [Hyalomma asiaticum]|uniref:Uncharacterized protein n=1 Tax=Hyalomma asiaticum TaxID=266040 RepID=A0ACB7RRQ1_HYAAI|nr:hypothetical protein HPB50_012466 [Hyalomma asiaticum]